MTDEQQRDIVRHWWMKAEESLASAKRECKAGSYSFSVNRLYYCCFYAVSAALLERKLSFNKHVAVRSTFHKEFMRTGTLDTAWGKLYDQLFEDRQMGDYLPLKTFTREYIESQIERDVLSSSLRFDHLFNPLNRSSQIPQRSHGKK